MAPPRMRTKSISRTGSKTALRMLTPAATRSTGSCPDSFTHLDLAERRPALAYAVMAPLICWSFSSSMFRYLLVDHAVPAMCRSLAAARLSADFPTGKRRARHRATGRHASPQACGLKTPLTNQARGSTDSGSADEGQGSAQRAQP